MVSIFPERSLGDSGASGLVTQRTRSLSGVNANGHKISEMVTFLQASRYKDQLTGRFEPLCHVMRATFNVERIAITLLCRHPETEKLTCYRIGGQQDEVRHCIA